MRAWKKSTCPSVCGGLAQRSAQPLAGAAYIEKAGCVEVEHEGRYINRM